MDSKFIPFDIEKKIYSFWEKNGIFEGKINQSKKPFSIVLPPPNANANLHLGHAMYVYEDIMIRYHKQKGDESLWIPGADHAGFETQYVFEKHLRKQDKSRFDYDRETLFKMIWDFVMENKSNMENQLRRLGFALDWSKEKFTLDKDIVEIVYKTFNDLYQQGLIYREMRLVNYCTYDGTSFSDLEVVDKQSEGKLYFIKYPLVEGGFIEVATTRPETMFGDVAVMVHPKDKRYKHLIGKTARIPIINKIIPIIADEYVEIKFGTGAVKVTPAHDFNDFEVGKRHNLPFEQILGFDGKIQGTNTEYDGKRVNEARQRIETELRDKGLLSDVKNHAMVLKTCYKCGRTLEPLPKDQWYVKIRPLADKAIELINKGKIKIYPSRYKKVAIQWLQNFHDWNISRQIVWGIQIPAWKCMECNQWVVTSGEEPSNCTQCKSNKLERDTDTFDTWFSSAQWPFATLKTIGQEYFDYYYPTSVMETGYDILPWWVARMIMIGYFVTKQEPFKTVFLHGMVRDKKGQKMSKSKGNVINPLEMMDKYGTDALRGALVYGTKEGGDLVLSEEKIIGMRNFTNKVWNIGRFIWLNKTQPPVESSSKSLKMPLIKQLEKELKEEKKKYLKYMEGYKFSQAIELVYSFLWHRFADYYIEELKDDLRNGNIEVLAVMEKAYVENLQMLHPFMPFVTEAVWQEFYGKDNSILNKLLS